jgi:hypothetical protein
MEALNASGASSLLTAPTPEQLINGINTLLADPLTDANLTAVEGLLQTVKPGDLASARAAVSTRIIALCGNLLKGDPSAASLSRVERLMRLPSDGDTVKTGVTPLGIAAGNSLLDGWVSDNDIEGIRKIVNLPLVNKEQIQRALSPRIGELWSIGQRTQLRVILNAV